ncbi:geranylgeranyl pyrophosphate synthetase [Truncatella angustata]|uniref:Geranylgeranyl pyrophosphate synthetase n=1 Tax=Truncatella angustata TaxID=152316 RepID=A0A9P8ZZQ5_9PEZI|nr:geranylgeranyl pyrophosphate synthetase [Truncatella angustata]KAH6656269.1 geranylgeranyl pyrophosphate synthetase [Truncatella angustata]
MEKISRSEAHHAIPSGRVSIDNVKHLASYNWLEKPSPTIVVPGSPNLWLAPEGLRRVKKDSGHIYINQNAARHSDSPLEPLFQALNTTMPSYDVFSADVVTDRNNLRKLFEFAGRDKPAHELEPFTMEVEVLGNTAFVSRVETSNSDTIQPDQFRGFGHEYGKAVTQIQVQGSTGHYRIISYNLGGLNFIIRHELQGFVDDDLISSVPDSLVKQTDQLPRKMDCLSIADRHSFASTPIPLTVQELGRNVPIEQTLAIKTRGLHRDLTINELAPQLWISQTPKLVRAYHEKGTFRPTHPEDISKQIKEWENNSQERLNIFITLIRKILEAVKRIGGRATVKYDIQHDELAISELSTRSLLPEDIRSKWKNPPSGMSNVKPPAESKTTQTNKGIPKITVEVGKIEYLINLKEMPFFKSLMTPEQLMNPDSAVLLRYDDIPFFAEIYCGLTKGPRQIFRSIPPNLDEYRVICRSLDFLSVDLLKGKTLRTVMDDFRSGKSDWDAEERHRISGQKSLARDSAFRLIYLFLSERSNLGLKDRDVAYNAVLFVISHSGIFWLRARKMVREAHEARFPVSEKQRKSLDKWPLEIHGGEGLEEEDDTPASGFFDYDSDWSF